MPKLARSDTKPCPLASLKKGPEILVEKGGPAVVKISEIEFPISRS
jgi:hypothetical protein